MAVCLGRTGVGTEISRLESLDNLITLAHLVLTLYGNYYSE
jgi:hypothetical protein